jgi:hypothetical protein
LSVFNAVAVGVVGVVVAVTAAAATAATTAAQIVTNMEGTAAVLIRTEDPETVFWSWKLEASGSPAARRARASE